MYHRSLLCFFGIAVGVACLASPVRASILGRHAFSWWDDPTSGTVVVTAMGAQAPSPLATHLLDLEEWHLDQLQTTQWYNGQAVSGLPTNPFNAANRTGIIGASAPVANAEAFIYRLTNVNYFSGNGTTTPFTFSDHTPPGPGVNDLSGINITDMHNALNIALPVLGSQFMFTSLINSSVLDMTPTSIVQPHDWDFNAYSGPGNFEWDIPSMNGAGVASGLPPAVFGFAMPGHWLDAVNSGWVHSWSSPNVGPIQVNSANSGVPGGFSGPRPIPEPVSISVWMVLFGIATILIRKQYR